MEKHKLSRFKIENMNVNLTKALYIECNRTVEKLKQFNVFVVTDLCVWQCCEFMDCNAKCEVQLKMPEIDTVFSELLFENLHHYTKFGSVIWLNRF